MLALVLLSALAFGGNRPVWWSLLAIAAFVILALQVVLSLTGPLPSKMQKLFWPSLLFLGVMAWAWVQTLVGLPASLAHPLWGNVPDAAGAISADPGQGRHAVMRLLSYGAIFVILAWTGLDSAQALTVLIVIALFSSVLALFGLFAFATGSNPVLGELADPKIVKATFINRNTYATYASFGVLANLAVALHLADRRSDSLRDWIEGFFGGIWIFALGVIVCMAAVALTQSRAGAAAGLIGLVVFLTVRSSGGRWRRFRLLLLLAVAVGFIALTNANGLMRNYMMTSSEDSRFVIYPAVVRAIGDRPLLGHGLGTFEDVFRAYIPESAAEAEYLRAHNTYLELAFGLGLPAAAVLFFALALIVWRIYRATQLRKHNRVFSCFALACIATAGFHSAFDFSLQIPAVAALFAAILAIGFAQSFSAKGERGRPAVPLVLNRDLAVDPAPELNAG